MTASDWDGESFCTAPGCSSEATHSRLVGMVGEFPLYELVCCAHAKESETA